MKNSVSKLFVLLASTFLSVSLSACGGNNSEEQPPEEKPQHIHHYDGYKVDGDYHYQKCTECGEETVKEKHRGGTSTCEHKAICEVCGAEYGALDEHQFGAWIMEDGNNEKHYHECSVCHTKEYADHVFDQEIERDEYLVGEKQTECEHDNVYYKSCRCGAYSTLETDIFTVHISHDFSLETVLDGDANRASEATCTEPASYYYVCSKCGAFDSDHPEHTFTYGEAKGHNYGTLHEEVKTFGTYHSNYYHCVDCGRYFEQVEEGGVTKYVEKEYEDVFDSSKNQYNSDETAGSEENPYIITCKEDIYYLRDLTNATTANNFAGKYFKVMNDIDFANDEEHTFGMPIGYGDAKPFSGIFDGQNHKFSNIRLETIHGAEKDLGDALALFSRLTNGTIKNLKLENYISFGSGQRCAGFVARMAGGTIENVELVSGHIKGTTECAGIVGCIIGDANNMSLIKNSINRAKIESIGNAYPCLGGIVGACVNNCVGSYKIESCQNYGLIDATEAQTLGYSGGIIGLTRVFASGSDKTGLITECRNFGDVTSSKGQLGGIAGIVRAGRLEHNYQYTEAKISKVVGDVETNPGETELYGGASKLGHIVGEMAAAGTGVAEHNCFCDVDGQPAHKLGEGQPLNDEATCYHVGHDNYSVCSICGETSGSIIPMTDHHMEWVTTEDTHEHKCTNDGCVVTEGAEPHNFVYQESEHIDPTPSQDGLNVYVCSICNYRKEEVLKYSCDSHVLVYNAGTPATCHSTGLSASYHCDACGRYYSDAEGEHEVTAASLILPIVPHSLVKHDTELGIAHEIKEHYTCSFADHDVSEGQYFDSEGNVLDESDVFIGEGSFGKEGYGTEANPYMIYNATDLWKVKDLANATTDNHTFAGEFIKLGADIDVTGDTNAGSIGNADSRPFSGTFDGNNHTITGFTRSGNDSIALFSRVTNGTISNLKMADVSVTITGSQRGAAVVARAENAIISNVQVLSGTISGKAQTGGIVAFALGTTYILDCINSATITSTGASTGGILGTTHTDTTLKAIHRCVNNGAITGASDGTGGIVGGNNNSKTQLTIQDCVNNGTVHGAGNGTGGILGATGGGGTSVTNITDCVNTGAISGAAYVGGIGGIMREGNKTDSLITGCTNKGNVVGTSVGVGGITGISRINTTNCKCLYTVTINELAASTLAAIGETKSDAGGSTPGIIGYITATAGNGATVSGILVDADGNEYVPAP